MVSVVVHNCVFFKMFSLCSFAFFDEARFRSFVTPFCCSATNVDFRLLNSNVFGHKDEFHCKLIPFRNSSIPPVGISVRS